MTKNQIEYQKLLETQRANRANEALTGARDEAVRRLGLDTLQETTRHNQQVELQARDNLAEQYRNNVAQLAELQRSHMANEGIANFREETNRLGANENIRHNLSVEEEAARHNQVTEAINQYLGQVNLEASQISAAAHTAAAGIAASASQYASDNALLAKQLDIDLNKYGIDTTAGLRRQELRESHRAATAREDETKRSNVVNEGLKAGSLVESIRHNFQTEVQQGFRNIVAARQGDRNLNIQQQEATTKRKVADANISLVPSQITRNYVSALKDTLPMLGNAAGIIGLGG